MTWTMHPSRNVLGTPLRPCSHDPLTGWFRDGSCNTDAADRGSHTVAAQVTAPFLAFLKSRGNDLVTPAPEHGFQGLVPGDRWCVCAASWYAAYLAGHACPVDIEATHARALSTVPLDALLEHALVTEEA